MNDARGSCCHPWTEITEPVPASYPGPGHFVCTTLASIFEAFTCLALQVPKNVAEVATKEPWSTPRLAMQATPAANRL